jgi:Cytochrome c554 and c-prime
VVKRVLWLLAALAASCASRHQPVDTRLENAAKRLTIVLSADIRGTLAPCGCSENMRGGIARAARYLSDLALEKTDVVYLDGGDTLFASAALAPDAVLGAQRKATALADALKTMHLSLKSAGAFDNAAGPAFRNSLALPEFSADGLRLLEVGGRRIGFVSGATVNDLTARAQLARQQGARVVLGLLDASFETAMTIPDDGPFNAVIATGAADESALEVNRISGTKTKRLALQSRLRSLARIDVTFGPSLEFEWQVGGAEQEREVAAIDVRLQVLDAEVNAPGINPALKELKQQKVLELHARRQALVEPAKVASSTATSASVRFVPLEASMPQSAEVKAIVAGYDAEVGRLNLQWAQKNGRDCEPTGNDGRGLVGSDRCQSCHPQAFDTWKKTKHSSAFAQLETLGKSLHLECVSCHVTGWQQPGGVCRIDKMEARKNVGCESCHGPGSAHVLSPKTDNVKRQVAQAVCIQCHNAENSPHFDWQAYLPHILGAGHLLRAGK